MKSKLLNTTSLIIFYITFLDNSCFRYCSDICLPTSKCNGSISCSENGHCFYDLRLVFNEEFDSEKDSFITCVCDRGYTDDPSNPDIKCCYKKKSQFAAFLLETIIGFGVGHFFIENYTMAFIKLAFQAFACCSCISIGFHHCYKTNKHNDEPSNKQKMLNVVFLSAIMMILVWQMVDVILFGINYYHDGNNVELETW